MAGLYLQTFVVAQLPGTGTGTRGFISDPHSEWLQEQIK
jgi:hypothetical protein